MRIDDPQDLGNRVRDRRKEMGWSQTRLAEEISSTRFWIADLEAGKPTLEIGLVLKALGALNFVVDVRSPSRLGAFESQSLAVYEYNHHPHPPIDLDVITRRRLKRNDS